MFIGYLTDGLAEISIRAIFNTFVTTWNILQETHLCLFSYLGLNRFLNGTVLFM